MVSGEETPGEDEGVALEGEESAIEIAEKVVSHGATTKTKGRGKKKEQLGPSGLPYTPLEKQFMEIKEANQDVLLLTEGKLIRGANRLLRLKFVRISRLQVQVSRGRCEDRFKRAWDRMVSFSTLRKSPTAGLYREPPSFPQRNFFVASIPTHRLHIHVKKYVSTVPYNVSSPLQAVSSHGLPAS
jgi:DNA mismatch repair protein MSH3